MDLGSHESKEENMHVEELETEIKNLHEKVAGLEIKLRTIEDIVNRDYC